MKDLYEYVQTRELIDRLDQPIEDYLNEHRNSPADWKDHVYHESSILYNEYLYESLLYSYSLEKFLSKLSDIFTIYTSELVNNEMLLYVRVGQDFNKEDKRFKSLCNLFNVFINKEERRTPTLTDITFEQCLPKEVTKDILKYDYLYHITDREHLDKILKYGLQPKSHSRKTYHPERVYLLKPTKELNLDAMKVQLGGSVVLKIDLIKLKKYNQQFHFYQDPMSGGNSAVFTENIIYPEAIEVTNL